MATSIARAASLGWRRWMEEVRKYEGRTDNGDEEHDKAKHSPMGEEDTAIVM